MSAMTLSEELKWRGFVNQTTLKDITELDNQKITFYWGVDPSADSMTVGNFAIAMMIKHFINHGHNAVLLVGGATGLIGDPDGKAEERTLKSLDEIEHNKTSIAAEYQRVFGGTSFSVVDNYDWFKDMKFLEFLRDVGKHVPMRQMLGREFVQSRLGEGGAGISYAEFSYSLIQGYDFLHLHKENGVTMQVCGADQWGNCIAGVELIRRMTGEEAHIWSAPLVINKATGKKFGKSEDGAVWLDPAKTSPTQFYQFWVNCDDEGVEDYMKIYTLLDKDEVESVMAEHRKEPKARLAQIKLAQEVTRIVHGDEATKLAEDVTFFITGKRDLALATEDGLEGIRKELRHTTAHVGESVIEVLVKAGLANSNGEARRLQASGGIYINGKATDADKLDASHFQSGRLLLRKGKALKDSALVEQKD